MAKSPLVLLNQVSQVGFGPVFDLEDRPILPLFFRVEPSADALVDSAVETAAFRIQYSLDSSFTATIPSDDPTDSPRTAGITEFPFVLVGNGPNQYLAPKPSHWPVVLPNFP